jgi:hypothetical protein
MQNIAILSAVMAALLVGTPVAWGDATTSPGKNSVAVSKSGLTVPAIPATIASGTIEKGKKKNILAIDVSVTDQGSSSSAIGVTALVNGLSDVMQPPLVVQLSECPASTWINCTTSAHLWVDLDAAEAAHPGLIIGQPLVIDLQAVANVPITGLATASLEAHLQKK